MRASKKINKLGIEGRDLIVSHSSAIAEPGMSCNRSAPVGNEEKKRNDENHEPDRRERPGDTVALMRCAVELPTADRAEQGFRFAGHRHQQSGDER